MNRNVMKTVLMTASVIAFMLVAMPASAQPDVMCSVKASYQGGVDVHGKPVAPADLPAQTMPTVRIPLTVDLAQRMNEVLPEGMKLEMQSGVVEIQSGGRVLFNGKDMTGPANVLCSNISRQKEAAMKTPDAAKKKKSVKKRAADVPADVSAPVPAQPVAPVATEPVPPAEPVAETPAAPEPAPVMEQTVMPEHAPAVPEEAPVPTPAPVPEIAPEPVPATDSVVPPMPVPTEPQVLQPAETLPAPAPEPAPATEGQSEILSPDGAMIPRPPAETPETLPAPAPNPDEMLSGGGQ